MCEDCGQHGDDEHGQEGDHSHDHTHTHAHNHGLGNEHGDAHGNEHEHAHGSEAGHAHGNEHGRAHGNEHPDAHGNEHEHADGAQAHAHDRERAGAPVNEAATVETGGTVRIAVTGKGGVGKTTLSASIARQLAAEGEVTAIDADPDMNLATTLDVEEPRPVTEERELVEERAGGRGGLISLTPEVEDVLESHSTAFGAGGRLLTIGAPAAANSGCMCPENSFIQSLVSSALDGDYVVMDMEAGVEHLGRGTAEAVEAIVIVVEPSRASIETAGRIQEMADELGIEEVRAVVNKTRDNADAVQEALDVPVVATLPYDEDVAAAGLAGESPVEESDRLRAAAREVLAAFRGERVAADGGE